VNGEHFGAVVEGERIDISEALFSAGRQVAQHQRRTVLSASTGSTTAAAPASTARPHRPHSPQPASRQRLRSRLGA
jgi:hypothetical protein